MAATDRIWQLIPSDDQYRLQAGTRPRPEPGPGEVLIRVRAVSLNYRDLINLRRTAGRNVAFRIPASDGAGEIVGVGAGVTQWQVGDRVAGCFFPPWQSGRFDLSYHKQDLGGTIDGMLAEHVVLPETGCVRTRHLTDQEMATLPCAGVTAWSALVARGDIRADATVLVLGTGGVSIFALQIAREFGARVIVTSSSDEKLERAQRMGAWQTVNYRTTPDWDQEVWKLTGKQGVDHVIEVGGPGTLEKSMQVVAASGQIALIGVLTGFGAPTASLFPLMARNVRLDGIYVGSRADFEQLVQFMEARQMRPVIDRVFAFDDVPAAYAHLESGEHFGKVVIEVT